MKSQHFLTYNNDLDDQIGVELGPNLFGEMFTVIEQSYDPYENKTRLGLVLSKALQ